MRKTKIICTLGPASSDESVMRNMMLSGMNVARFNFSHGTHEEHLEKLKTVRKLRDELGLPIATMLDTKGPEIRLRDFEGGKAILTENSTFTITTREIMGNATEASITYKHLPEDVEPGMRILLDDGLIELRVEKLTDTDITCTVVNGGKISNHKGVNVPGAKLSMPYISATDRKDILFGIEQEFDYVAASFVRSARDLLDLKELLNENGGKQIKIIAKIENAEGMQNLDEIIRFADGLMVARGDLGVEVELQEIPILQKQIIKKAAEQGRVVITATQMLESMINNPRPTRAEANDVANAIYDGTSAIMLSGETAAGKYPVEAVRTMAAIAERIEQDIDYKKRFQKRDHPAIPSITDAISHATCTTAYDLGAKAVITVSKSGRTARMVSKYRPSMPIIACTTDPFTCRQLNMSWGVAPIMFPEQTNTDALFDGAVSSALASGLISVGDLVVLTAGVPVGVSGSTNLLKVQTAGSYLVCGEGLNPRSAVGKVCIAESDQDVCSKMNPGDVLVCRQTNDSMSDLLETASAIITETDGPHISKIASQLKIPVIVGAKDCTKLLSDGMCVIVSGKTGIVSSLEAAKK